MEQGGSGCELIEAAGERAAVLAQMLWLNMDGRHRRQCLWDVPMAGKKDVLAALCRDAAWCAFCGERGADLAAMPESRKGGLVAGLFIIDKGGGVGAVHFAVAGKADGLERAAAMALRNALGRFDRIIGCIPTHWHGARALAKRLGFAECGILPFHCWLEEYGRRAHGHVHVLAGPAMERFFVKNSGQNGLGQPQGQQGAAHDGTGSQP